MRRQSAAADGEVCPSVSEGTTATLPTNNTEISNLEEKMLEVLTLKQDKVKLEKF